MVRVKTAVFNFIKNKKAAILISLSVLALISCLMLTNLTGKAVLDTNDVITITEADLRNDGTSDYVVGSYFFGYDTSAKTESGDTVFKVIGDDPQIFVNVGMNVGYVNTVKVSFKSLENYSIFQVYYLIPGESELSEPYSRFGGLGGDGLSCVALIPKTDLRALRLDISGDFVLDKIELSHVLGVEAERGLSIPALGLLIFTLLLAAVLLIFEKKLGYRAYIKGVFLEKYGFLRDALRERRIAVFAVRIAYYLFISAFALALMILTFMSKYSAGTALIITVLGTLAAASYITDKALSEDVKSAAMFLALCIILGFSLAYMKPLSVGGGWDEAIHYRNTVALKNTLFGGEYTLADLNLESNVYYYNRYDKEGEEMFAKLLYEDETKLSAKPLVPTLYKAVGYLPSAAVTALCELLDADIIKTLFLSKAINVLVYAFVLYFGMRKLKSGVLIFSSVALMPTAMFISTTVNYDSWVTAFIFGAFMYFIGLIQDRERKITLKDFAVMLVMLFLGCGPKAVYCVLALPFLFAPNDRFENKKKAKHSRIAVLATLVLIALIMLLPFVTDIDILTDDRGDVGGMATDAGAQIDYILSNPLKYTKTLAEYVLEYLALDNANRYATAYLPFGYAPAYLGTLSLIMLIAMAILDRSEYDVFKGSRLLKLGSIAAFLGTVVLVATTLYISFTPVGYDYINGVQYRYMLPALPMILYAGGSGRLIKGFDRKILTVTAFSILSFTVLASSYEIFIRGWIEWAIYDGGFIPF